MSAAPSITEVDAAVDIEIAFVSIRLLKVEPCRSSTFVKKTCLALSRPHCQCRCKPSSLTIVKLQSIGAAPVEQIDPCLQHNQKRSA